MAADPQRERERERVGKNLRALREAHALTPLEMAQLLGVSRCFLYNVEAGRKALPRRRLTQIADLLGVNPSVITRKRTVAAKRKKVA